MSIRTVLTFYLFFYSGGSNEQDETLWLDTRTYNKARPEEGRQAWIPQTQQPMGYVREEVPIVVPRFLLTTHDHMEMIYES